ncbi:hypothetical protein [Congregibacter sp.]|uniref:hypothetical protein n=1 Tax=Congregibacter sp. TaxID=2744308 RepID=UPI003F6D4F13
MSEARVAVFTSAARNYLPKVRVLFDSLERYHPEWERHLVLVERDVHDADLELANAQSIKSIPDLGIPDWEPWSFCHRVVELATAVKPFALKQLLASGDFDHAVYLDPDIAVFSRLDDVVDGLDTASILLSPHQLVPEASLGRVIDNEVTSLQCGVYNLGFLAVNRDAVGEAFADWWSQRLYFFCRDDKARGLFTDQKWADLIPALFPSVGILRSSRHNVASWNLSERNLTVRDDCFWVDENPLGFYHFTAVSSDSHELMALKNSDNPAALRKILDWYRAEEGRVAMNPTLPWSFARYADGTVIPDVHRAMFRDRCELQSKYPNPYDSPELRSALDTSVDLAPSGDQSAELPLSSGYSVNEARYDQAKLRRLLRLALTDPSALAKLSKKAINVLSREGIQGVKRVLR